MFPVVQADVNDFALSLYRNLPLHNAIDYIRIQRSVTQVQKYTCKSVSKTIGEEYTPPPPQVTEIDQKTSRSNLSCIFVLREAVFIPPINSESRQFSV